jgi:hypothetical protein
VQFSGSLAVLRQRAPFAVSFLPMERRLIAKVEQL